MPPARDRNAKDAAADGFPDRQTIRRATAALSSFSSRESSTTASRNVPKIRKPSSSGAEWVQPGSDHSPAAPAAEPSTSQGRGQSRALAQAAEVQALREEVGHLRELLEALEGRPPDADPSRLAWMKLVGHTAQLQRQVATMDAELQASRAVAAEAEAALEEVCGGLQQLQGRCQVADVCGACGGPLQALVERQLQHLHRQRAQAADHLSRSASTSGQPGGSWGSARESGSAMEPSPWHIPYTPAGGNRFLQAHRAAASASGSSGPPPLTVPALGRQQPGLADPAQVLDLQEHLCHLGPRLAGLSVLLHTALLPALPWTAPAIRQQLEGELEATTRDVTLAAGALVELGCACAAGDALGAQPGRRTGPSGALGLSEVPPALKPLHAEFEAAIAEMKGRLAAVPRDQRAGLKAALAAGQQLADRFLVEASALAQRSSVVQREVEWVGANVAQQAEAVWRLLFADSGGPSGRGAARLSSADVADRHLLAAAGLQRMHEAVAQVAAEPSQESLRDLVQCTAAQQHHLAAAAAQQELLAHTAAVLQASSVGQGRRGR